ncbi:hypothetical protein ACWGB8_30445 [Kitasatospora sp. NPDC054939]
MTDTVPPALLPTALPVTLSWPEVDPRVHPFDADSALAAVRALRPSALVPERPAGGPADAAVVGWVHGEGGCWAEELNRALVDRFGAWAAGWRWGRDEGVLGDLVGAVVDRAAPAHRSALRPARGTDIRWPATRPGL